MGMTEQEKRDKVIKELECIRDWSQFAVNKRWLVAGATEKMVKYAEDALELLKAQEPRVMTLEDLQKIASIRDGAVWLETGAGLMPAFMEFAMKDITFFVAVPLTGYRQFFENDWYGKTWRCWTSRPTDEQRQAVKWDD